MQETLESPHTYQKSGTDFLVLWSGLGASHRVNLIAPFPLGHNCPRKIARIREHEVQYDGLSWHNKLHHREVLLSSFHLNDIAAESVWLWVQNQTLLIITIEMINRKLKCSGKVPKHSCPKKSPRQCYQPLCGLFVLFCFVLWMQFLFTGRTLALLTVPNIKLTFTLTLYLLRGIFVACGLPKLTFLHISGIQLSLQRNIIRCIGLLVLLSRAVNTLLIRIAWLDLN